jgi:hypothetical protein
VYHIRQYREFYKCNTFIPVLCNVFNFTDLLFTFVDAYFANVSIVKLPYNGHPRGVKYCLLYSVRFSKKSEKSLELGGIFTCTRQFILQLTENVKKKTNENMYGLGIYIPGVEWMLVHRHFTCKSKNSRILAPLIIWL